MMKLQVFLLLCYLSSTLPEIMECRDYPPMWHDSDGEDFDCEWYSQPSHCETHGYGYENRGYTAQEACCTCGGGKWSRMKTNAPTGNPTEYPTQYPTRSPSEELVTCHGYVNGYNKYTGLAYQTYTFPAPLECGSPYGDDWMPQYHESSCCTNEAHYLGAIGGFDYDLKYASGTCLAHAESMKAILCDPNQGRYVDEYNILRVCLSSCEALFDACGMPGEAYPATADYDDARSLCYQLWDGFGSSRWGSTNTCDVAPDKNYVCQSGLNMNVVNGENCLAMSKPSREIIAYYDRMYERAGFKPSVCNGGYMDEDDDDYSYNDDDSGSFDLVGTIVNTTFIFILLCAVVSCWRSCFKNAEFICSDPSFDEPPTNSIRNNHEEPEIEVTASVVSPSAPPLPLPVAVPAPEPLMADIASQHISPVPFNPARDSEGEQGQRRISHGRNDFDERRNSNIGELSFEQKLDLRELEHEKDAGIISEEQYRERLAEIMSRRTPY